MLMVMVILSYIRRYSDIYKNKKLKVLDKIDSLRTLELLNSFYVSSEIKKNS